MKTLRVRITFTEPVLGTASSNPEVHREYIASKAPDAQTAEEEVASIGVDASVQKQTTVFPRMPGGGPMLWDYQLKGFFKDASSAMRQVPGTKSEKVKAHKKIIDGTVFVFPRRMPLLLPSGKQLSRCERPLRAQTAQGERVALAASEEAPAGTSFDCEIRILRDSDEPWIRELLDYGALRGIGCWRNSGKGRFSWILA